MMAVRSPGGVLLRLAEQAAVTGRELVQAARVVRAALGHGAEGVEPFEEARVALVVGGVALLVLGDPGLQRLAVQLVRAGDAEVDPLALLRRLRDVEAQGLEDLEGGEEGTAPERRVDGEPAARAPLRLLLREDLEGDVVDRLALVLLALGGLDLGLVDGELDPGPDGDEGELGGLEVVAGQVENDVVPVAPGRAA